MTDNRTNDPTADSENLIAELREVAGVNPLDVTCGECGSKPGKRCYGNGEMRRTHSSRASKAEHELRAAAADALEAATRERDAALTAIERVRDLANSLRDRYADNSDAAYFTKQFLAALDGAPEPECEYAAGYIALDGKPHPFENRGYLRFAAEADREKYGSDEAILVRRRKAGPWEPVGGEG